MTLTPTRRALISGGLALCACPAAAAPRAYDLLPDRSRILFRFDVGGTAQTGEVPVSQADIRVDTDNLAASSASVTADISRARTGFAPVTQALHSPSVLDAASYPLTRFVSTRIRLGARGRISEGATITGDLTLRGVTRPLTLDAVLSRPAGSAPDDLSFLYVDLTGSLNRRDFGATGYPDLVADTVTLDIHAEIRARG